MPSMPADSGRAAAQDLEVRGAHPLQAGADQPASPVSVPERFYALFLEALAVITASEPLPSAEISKRTGIGKRQVDAWLKRARSEGTIARETNPVRYRWSDTAGSQAALPFPDANVDGL